MTTWSWCALASPEDMLDAADPPPRSGLGEESRRQRGSDTLPGAKWLFMPINTGRGAVGVVGIGSDEPGRSHAGSATAVRRAGRSGALAIEQVNLVEDVDRARLVAETDRLRAALLTSLRTICVRRWHRSGSATSLSETPMSRIRLDLTRNIRMRRGSSIDSSATCWT
jgi:hypothetical protein